MAPPDTEPVPASTALLVIDMQNDFLLPNAPLCVAGGMACVPLVHDAVSVARSHRIPVIWVVREHGPSGIDVERFRENLYRDGRGGATVRGTHGAAIVDGLNPRPTELKVVKTRFSAFFQTNLDAMLRRAGITHLILAGVQTPNCIRATAYDALALDYNVAILSDATASATDKVQQANLEDMENVGIYSCNVSHWQSSVLCSISNEFRDKPPTEPGLHNYFPQAD